ncbi:dTMP kinase [Candidatus Woesearchaeota archaeon]|nr:dTMP kinase [Candidatus Woesearchaeota archaeon]
MKGTYIVFEGIVGTGKTTQAKKIFEFLKKAFPGRKIILTREPGGSEIAESIRKVVQATKFKEDMNPVTEAYLYASSRAQTLRTVVKPVLDEGGIVISDRSFISSVAYQGTARGLGLNEVLEINRYALGDILPDMIIYFNIDPEIGTKRTFDKSGDKFENEDVDFFRNVHDGYMTIAKTPGFNEIWTNLDASGSRDEVFERIKEKISKTLHLS